MFACHLHSSDQSCVCRVTFKHLPHSLKSHIRCFGPLQKLFKNLKMPPGGQGGGLRISLGVNISFFCENKPPVKFQNSNWLPSKIFKKIFWSTFSPNQAILRTFRFFHFFWRKQLIVVTTFWLPSTKIVVTMFACHLHSSDQSCVCRVNFKHLPQPLRSHIRSFGTIFSKKDLKIAPRGPGGGGPNFIFSLRIFLFIF